MAVKIKKAPRMGRLKSRFFCGGNFQFSGLFAVVADSLNWAGFERLIAESRFRIVRGLLLYASAAFIGEFEKAFGRRRAKAAADALGIDIEFAGNIKLIFFVFVCHSGSR